MKHTHWLLIPFTAWCCSAMAAPPTAGALQPPATDATKPGSLVTPTIRQSPPLKTLQQADAGVERVAVQRLQFMGIHMFTPGTLNAVCDFQEGATYSLVDLREMATRIERYYHAHGYPVAQAYLPAQDVVDGVITIAISEGHYGQVLVRNQSHVATSVLANGLQNIKPGELVIAAPLERQLLLLSDLPGTQIGASLVPGADFGNSDLLVDVLPSRRVTGSVDVDNAGNYYTGAVRAGATIFLNEPAGEGDVASLRLLTSGEGLNYLRAAYQLQIGQARVGVAFSKMRYALGHEFTSLVANGTADTESVFGSYPLVRSRNENLFIGASYDSKQFEDRLDSVASTTEKSTSVFGINLTGDKRDSLGAGGISTFALGLSSGTLTILTATALAYDATTVESDGQFSKLSYSASRLQNISPSLALYAGVNGQMASKNLDASEKMQLGGMFGVRAYPEGEGFGDEGYVVNLEARWQVPRGWRPDLGELQLVGFIDTGSVTLYKNPWSTASNQRHLSGTGIGLNWSSPDRFLLRVAYAHKLGDEAALAAPDAESRLWFQGVMYF